MQQAISKLIETLDHYFDLFIAFLPRFVVGILIVSITAFLSVRLARFFSNRLHTRIHDKLSVDFIRKLIRYALIATGLALAANVMGFGGLAGSLVAGAGITAFVVGFAFKDIGENFLAGIILAFKRPFEVGDLIKSGDVKGRVITLDLRETRVKTAEGVDVFIPNSDILDNPLYNYSSDGHERYQFEIVLPDNKDFAAAREIILHEINNTKGVDEERHPTVTIGSIKESQKTLCIYYWIDHSKYNDDVHYLQGLVMQNVKMTLVKKGFIAADKSAATPEDTKDDKDDKAETQPSDKDSTGSKSNTTEKLAGGGPATKDTDEGKDKGDNTSPENTGATPGENPQ